MVADRLCEDCGTERTIDPGARGWAAAWRAFPGSRNAATGSSAVSATLSQLIELEGHTTDAHWNTCSGMGCVSFHVIAIGRSPSCLT